MLECENLVELQNNKRRLVVDIHFLCSASHLSPLNTNETYTLTLTHSFRVRPLTLHLGKGFNSRQGGDLEVELLIAIC